MPLWHAMTPLTPVVFLTLLAVMPLSPACFDSIPASFTNLFIVSVIGLVFIGNGTCVCERLHEEYIVEEHLRITKSARAD